jgi:cytochrome c oxidase subunit 2
VSVLVPAVDTRDAYAEVASVYAPIGAAVFVIVCGAIGLLVWRGRRRARPGGREERPVAEAVYVGMLAAIVVVLVVVTFRGQSRIESAAAKPALVVGVTAAKWNWTFRYPGTGIEVTGRPGAPATLVVPSGREVRFTGNSLDVLHGFWIPERRFQRILVPGRSARFSIVFGKPGRLDSATCSFFCGLGHADMRFTVEVLAPADFDVWLQSHRGRR